VICLFAPIKIIFKIQGKQKYENSESMVSSSMAKYGDEIKNNLS